MIELCSDVICHTYDWAIDDVIFTIMIELLSDIIFHNYDRAMQ